MIRRLYENPFEGHTRRHFCGFCGTPLTYWSDLPRGEANYIQVTMGSLSREDLGDLEDLGLIPETPTSSSSSSRGPSRDSPVEGGSGDAMAVEGDDYQQQQQRVASPRIAIGTSSALASTVRGGRETTSIPWFDTLLEGSRLAGRMRPSKGSRQSADGTTRVKWEVVEYTNDPNDPDTPSTGSGKRKLGDRDDADDAQMEGVNQ